MVRPSANRASMVPRAAQACGSAGLPERNILITAASPAALVIVATRSCCGTRKTPIETAGAEGTWTLLPLRYQYADAPTAMATTEVRMKMRRMLERQLTLRLTDPAPVMSALQPRHGRGIRCRRRFRQHKIYSVLALWIIRSGSPPLARIWA